MKAASRVPQPIIDPFAMAGIANKMKKALSTDPDDNKREGISKEHSRFLEEAELAANEDPYQLPVGGLAPRCRTSGQRIRLFYVYPHGYQATEPWEALKPWGSIARANLKFIFESGISSEQERFVDLNVECYPPGHPLAGYPTIRTIAIDPDDPAHPRNLFGVIDDFDWKLYQAEGTVTHDVRNLVFYAKNTLVTAGASEGDVHIANLMTRSQTAANYWNDTPLTAAVGRSSWIRNTVVHGILHSFGAVAWDHPLSTNGGHCLAQYDVMCYDDNGSRSHIYPLISPESCSEDQMYGIRIDCVEALYFRADHGDGTILDPWLEQKWNTIGAENRFVNAYPAWDYHVPCSKC